LVSSITSQTICTASTEAVLEAKLALEQERQQLEIEEMEF